MTLSSDLLQVASVLEGRDKLTKFTQYSSRALAFYVLSVNPQSDIGQKLFHLFKSTQQARKAFRIGKSLTYYEKIENTLTNKVCIKKINEIHLLLVFHVGC